ncbi:MAG: hypothetical protein OEV40_03390 [Acidimicrobiia bacterium]|nr:hypothetical protein [Acidimicrobiia bacterium]
MFTWGSKYLFTVAVASLLGAAVYGLVTGGGVIGIISMGYKGAVGEHTGYTILVTIAIVSALLGVLDVVIRDGDADDAAAAVGVDQALTVATPRAPSFWGPLAAFGVACLAVGLAVSQVFVILGIVVLSVVVLEWVVLAWSDRATGDPEVNTVIKNRMLGPVEVPMLSMLGIAVVVIGLSRVLLAVSEAGATAVAALVAAFIFFAAVAIAKSDAPRPIISGVVAFAAIAVLAGGIVGAVVGERDIAHHEESETHDEDGPEGEGE